MRDVGSGVGEADATRSLTSRAHEYCCNPSAGTANPVVRHRRSRNARLRRAPQRNDRQMLPAHEELDVQFQPCAGLVARERPRSGAWRAAGPASTRFISRSTCGGKTSVVDLFGRPPAERRCKPARASIWAIFFLPSVGQSVRRRRTVYPMTSEYTCQVLAASEDDDVFVQRRRMLASGQVIKNHPLPDCSSARAVACGKKTEPLVKFFGNLKYPRLFGVKLGRRPDATVPMGRQSAERRALSRTASVVMVGR